MTRRFLAILIVDDEPFNVDYLEQELEDLGYRTLSARNGQEALERVAGEPPDLILLDVMMPVMDGFTACRLLKDHEETRMIPIVIMTALDGFEDRIKGIEAGADDFLTKPVNQRELVSADPDLSPPQAHASTGSSASSAGSRITSGSSCRRRSSDWSPRIPTRRSWPRRERDVSVLFLDISGYTRLSEQIAPERLNALVERYFSTFLDRIQQAGGDINETAGDGFMAIFQDTDPPGARR